MTSIFRAAIVGAILALLALACTPSVRPPPDAGGGAAGGSLGTGGSQYVGGAPPACRSYVTKSAESRTVPRVRNPRIVGGRPSLPGVWPFVAALETATSWQFCGGTLVRPQWVLTAAHCEVRVGELVVLDRLDLTRPGGEVLSVDEVRTHADYLNAELGSDVALLHLSRPAKTAPTSLVDAAWSGPGLLAAVVGWGLTSEYASGTSPVQRETEVPILAQSVCQSAYPGIPSTALCAGYAEGGRDTCQGDSGGPLLVQADGWRVAGITSYGDGCARPGKPGVYTDVAKVRAWIDACSR